MGQDTPAPYLGYPDMGAGTYSRILATQNYKGWFDFNCAQRVHQNNIEHLVWTLPSFMMLGVFVPRITAGLGLVVIGGRELYRFGYMSPEGPTSKIREQGAYPLNISELLLASGVLFMFLRYQFGGFVSRRKLIQRLTMSRHEVELAALKDDILKDKDGRTIETHIPGEESEIA